MDATWRSKAFVVAAVAWASFAEAASPGRGSAPWSRPATAEELEVGRAVDAVLGGRTDAGGGPLKRPESVIAWVVATLDRDVAPPAPPPPEVAAWLDERADAIDRLVAILDDGVVPRWTAARSDEDRAGITWLRAPLLARALEAAARGDRAASDAALCAAWTLMQRTNAPGMLRLLRQVRPSDAHGWMRQMDAGVPPVHPRHEAEVAMTRAVLAVLSGDDVDSPLVAVEPHAAQPATVTLRWLGPTPPVNDAGMELLTFTMPVP